MAVKAAVVPVATTAPSWTGFYIGGNAGVIWSNTVNYGLSTPAGPTPPNFTGLDAPLIAQNGSGGLGGAPDFTFGAEAGYNYQLDRTLVGAEFDVERWGLKRNTAVTAPTVGAGLQTTTTSVSAEYLTTLRGRFGYVFDRSLFYVTGGAAFANIKERQATSFAIVPTADDAFHSGEWGWTVGGGTEYALDMHWSVKAEYLYVHFDSTTFTTNPLSPNGVLAGNTTFVHNFSSVNADIVRVGANYKFW
jgi:outer membrane immunogenic protein